MKLVVVRKQQRKIKHAHIFFFSEQTLNRYSQVWEEWSSLKQQHCQTWDMMTLWLCCRHGYELWTVLHLYCNPIIHRGACTPDCWWVQGGYFLASDLGWQGLLVAAFPSGLYSWLPGWTAALGLVGCLVLGLHKECCHLLCPSRQCLDPGLGLWVDYHMPCNIIWGCFMS